jgi:hypothetical protein
MLAKHVAVNIFGDVFEDILECNTATTTTFFNIELYYI